MRLEVVVLHNVAHGSFFGFEPANAQLRHAHTFDVVADSVNDAARLLFLLGNVDSADALPPHLSHYGSQVEAYRNRLNRSLSVGDVLVIVDLARDEQIVGVMACEPVGWRGLEYVPDHESGSNLTPTSKSYEAYRLEWSQSHN